MSVLFTARGSRVLAVALLLLAALLATIALGNSGAAQASADSPVASAAAKRCGGGKVLVRRPGRSSVCAKKCPAGKKRKVSSRGKVSCVRKGSSKVDSGPAPAPTGDAAPTPPMGGSGEPSGGSGGAKAGAYSGETEQGRTVTFNVVGNEVRDFQAGVNTWCTTMYNNRLTIDAIANVPPIAIGPDGSFSYEGTSDEGNPKINGVITGGSATGTVGMMRGDSNYSGGQTYYGQCSASDVKWTANAG